MPFSANRSIGHWWLENETLVKPLAFGTFLSCIDVLEPTRVRFCVYVCTCFFVFGQTIYFFSHTMVAAGSTNSVLGIPPPPGRTGLFIFVLVSASYTFGTCVCIVGAQARVCWPKSPWVVLVENQSAKSVTTPHCRIFALVTRERKIDKYKWKDWTSLMMIFFCLSPRQAPCFDARCPSRDWLIFGNV